MELVDKYFKVLDDGFIALKAVMGGDEDVEQAARVSYGKGTRKVSETRGLIRYLMRHRHTTPFEMVEFKFHVRVPMDCWRQWIRHRTASVNEYSTRYSEAIDSQQTTRPDEWRSQSTNNKQGSGDFLDELIGRQLCQQEDSFHEHAKTLYQNRLESGVAREQARKDLPLSTYTEAYWKCDLKNILNFLSLRCDSHAQLEIRQYANVMAGIVKECCPLTFEAWYDYAFQASNFTRLDKLVLQKEFSMVENYNEVALKEYAKSIGMSDREFGEYKDKTSMPTPQDFDLSNWSLYV